MGTVPWGSQSGNAFSWSSLHFLLVGSASEFTSRSFSSTLLPNIKASNNTRGESGVTSFGIAWYVTVILGVDIQVLVFVFIFVVFVDGRALTGRLSNRLRFSCAWRLNSFTIGYSLLLATLQLVTVLRCARRATSGRLSNANWDSRA